MDQNWVFLGILPKLGGAEGDFRGGILGIPKLLPVSLPHSGVFHSSGLPRTTEIQLITGIQLMELIPSCSRAEDLGFSPTPKKKIHLPPSQLQGEEWGKTLPKKGILGKIPFWSIPEVGNEARIPKSTPNPGGTGSRPAQNQGKTDFPGDFYLPKHGKIPPKTKEKRISHDFSFWELLSCWIHGKIVLKTKEKQLFHDIFPPKTWERPTAN